MAEANRLYGEGQYERAIGLYKGLIEAQVADGVVYYNLGNAYYKRGDLGRAILNYRRAQRLMPRDRDVLANLKLARAQTADRLESDEEAGLASVVQRAMTESTSLDESAMLLLALWSLVCALAVGAILWPPGRRVLRGLIVAVSILVGLSGISLGNQVWAQYGRTPGVIVAKSVGVHSGPGIDYLLEFSLHAGTEVQILDDRDDWVRIVLPGNLQGWMPHEGLEEL